MSLGDRKGIKKDDDKIKEKQITMPSNNILEMNYKIQENSEKHLEGRFKNWDWYLSLYT